MKSMDLWEFCREYPLEEKIFIVPTRAIGLQMIDKITRDGHRSLNLEPITLKRLAFDICQEYIEREGKLIIDHILGTNLIMDILKDLSNKLAGDFFFKEELIDSKTAEEVYKVIKELKHNVLKNFPKEKNLDLIYEEYEKRLVQLNAMDYEDVIIKAIELDSIEEYKKKKIGLAYNIEYENIEKNLLERLISQDSIRIKMPVKSLVGKPRNYYFKERAEIGQEGQKTIDFYEAYGHKNEIQYIIKDIFKRKIAIDQVVIAYSHSKYADLLNVEFEKAGIPISHGEGLDIESSSVYRFIETIFSWAENYYSIEEIRPIFINGDIEIEIEAARTEGSISASSIYEELVRSRIVFGKENYKKMIINIDGKLNVDNKEELASYIVDRRLWLKEFFTDLFYAVPEEKNICLGQYIPRLVKLINKYVKNFNKYDGAAKGVVLETLSLLENIDMKVSKSEYFNIVLSYIRKNRILRAQAQPGHVFATGYQNAGYTGRRKLYFIGLDSDSLSSKTMESPILLDSMKRTISGDLSSANESYRYKKYKIRELLTGDFENISIGFSNFDTVDIKEKSPSQIYTELKTIYRPWENKLEERPWTIKGKDLISSGTGLEVLADCSRKAYLRYKLKLSPIEDVDIRIDRWLDGLSRGSLVHEILNEYFDLEKEKKNDETLRLITEEACQRTKEEIPYAIEEVYLREKEDIFESCHTIVVREREDKEWEVLVNELSFGVGQLKDNKIFGRLGMIDIDLAGHPLRVAGSIDRIDVSKENPQIFRIIDYKTGNKNNFEKRLRQKSGRGKNAVIDYSDTRKFQYYIYSRVLEKILDRAGDLYDDPRIKNFLYIFGGDDHRALIDVELSEEDKKQIEEKISNLLDLDILEADKSIVYDPKDMFRCKYCDYKSICMVDKDLNQEVEEEVYG